MPFDVERTARGGERDDGKVRREGGGGRERGLVRWSNFCVISCDVSPRVPLAIRYLVLCALMVAAAVSAGAVK